MNDTEKILENLMEEGLKATLAYTRDQWFQKADQGLKSTREDYIRGISEVKIKDKTSGSIFLEGDWPVMLEQGFQPFDIKDGFKRSPKVKKARKGGWYLTIPFRHRTTSGKNVLPSNVLRSARKLGHKEALTSAVIRELGHKPQISHTGYQWRNSKYDGLTRIIKSYPNKKSSQYVTFRRVGSKSDPRSWIHKGYKGLHAMKGLEQQAEKFFYDFMEANL